MLHQGYRHRSFLTVRGHLDYNLGSVQCDCRRSGLVPDGLGVPVVEVGRVLCKGSVQCLECLWVFLVHLCIADLLRYTGCLLVCWCVYDSLL